MNRFLMTSGWTILSLAISGGELSAASRPSPADSSHVAAAHNGVISTRVVDISAEQGIVALEVGSGQGISVGDDFWLWSDEGVTGWGEVFLVMADRCAGRLAAGATGTPTEVTPGQPAVILRHASLAELRDRLPPGATVRGTIARVAPGRLTAWIDISADSGLRVGDQMVVLRKGLPLSRGRISLLDAAAALTTLEPLVGNALPEPGDVVELWPAPSDACWGRLTTTILQVTEVEEGAGKGAQISIAGSANDGIRIERLVDVYRGRKYIGAANVVEVSSPNSRANMIVSASRMREDPERKHSELWPAEGDRAIVRSAANAKPGPMLVAVFHIDQDYCLLAAGETDGVKVGETFLVRRQDPHDAMIWHDVALLTVKKVETSYSGALVRPLTSEVEGLRVWDMAERQLSGIEQWRTVGIVESVDVVSRTALTAIDPGCAVGPGDVVSWIPDSEASLGGAVVLHRDPDRLILHVPPGWGDLAGLPRARVDALLKNK